MSTADPISLVMKIMCHGVLNFLFSFGMGN